MRILQATVIVVLGAVADLATKSWAFSRLSGGHDITLAGGLLRLQLVINHGASFGLGSGFEPALTVLTLVIVVLLWLWAVRTGSSAERIGAALAAAGGTGNVVDRLIRPPAVLHGGVVDWLHVSFYGPTFNLADIMLRGGVVLAAVAWLLGQRTAKATTASAGPAPVPPASMLAAVNPANPPDPDRAEAPVVPTQSREDTDAEWGEVPEPSDDDRLYRDRPPHWGSD
ncbi:MAG TPA: signal peptidase II [Streptosporangiaceae bacterium]